jgi:hypothetical protein
VVKIELQVVADCPHEAPTAQLLRRALDDVGLPTTRFTTVVVTGHEHAEQLRFTGSPTIRIDGVDPFADPAGSPSWPAGCTAPPLGCPEHRISQHCAGS